MSFAACDHPRPCGPQGLQSHYLLDLLARVEGGARRVAAAGRTPLFLHIGAATLGNGAYFADLDLYKKVHSLLPGEIQESYKIVLVEPNRVLFRELELNAGKLPVGMRRVKIVNSMVTDSCREDGVTKMYRFSQAIESDFGVAFSMAGTWLGTDRSFPLRALGGFLSQERGHSGHPKRTTDGLRRLNNSANLSSYVKEIEVPCHTPATLLAAAGMEARNLVMAVIDAEGADGRIVEKLVGLPDFKPAYLQWEGRLVVPESARLAEDLRARGFRVGQVYPAGNNFVSDDINIVALSEE